MTHNEEHLREIAQRYIDGNSLATGELTKLAHGVGMLLVTIETLRGSRCAVAQGVDGIGGCGVCPSCARDARVRAETAALRADRLRTELAEARAERDAALTRAEAEVARLREVTPTDEERCALDSLYRATVEHATGGGVFPVTARTEAELAKARAWFARRDAAKRELGL